MNKEQEKILLDAYETTSETAKKFIHNEEYVNIILKINKDFKLTESESETVQVRTLYILLNIESEKEAISEIVLALRNRTAAETEKIVKEIEEKILIHK